LYPNLTALQFCTNLAYAAMYEALGLCTDSNFPF